MAEKVFSVLSERFSVWILISLRLEVRLGFWLEFSKVFVKKLSEFGVGKHCH